MMGRHSVVDNELVGGRLDGWLMSQCVAGR